MPQAYTMILKDDACCGPKASGADDLASSKRISVLVGPHSVPLFPGLPVTGSEKSPWTGLLVERHHHGPVAIPEHEHPTFCLHLQMGGPAEMDWQSFGKTGNVKFGAGSLILLTPGTRDSVLWHGVSDRIVTSIHPSLVTQAAEGMELKGTYDFDNCWSFEDQQLRLLLTEMDREASSYWETGALYGDLLGMCLSSALIKNYGHRSSVPVLLKGGLSRSHLKQVLEYIDENLHRDLRLKELSALTGLSTFHFARSFRDSSGVTPHQYVVQMRVERAKALLLRRELTIQQVASATGFADGSQLSKIFRKALGVSPSQWRRML